MLEANREIDGDGTLCPMNENGSFTRTYIKACFDKSFDSFMIPGFNFYFVWKRPHAIQLGCVRGCAAHTNTHLTCVCVLY